MTHESSGNSGTRNKFGFCKLLREIPEQNSGTPGSGFRLRVFLSSPNDTPPTVFDTSLVSL
jgi:hypothetical protein